MPVPGPRRWGRRGPGGARLRTMSADHLEDLRAQAKYARDRYQLYKARAYAGGPTSPERLRELQQAHEQAAARLRFAEAEAERARAAAERSPESS